MSDIYYFESSIYKRSKLEKIHELNIFTFHQAGNDGWLRAVYPAQVLSLQSGMQKSPALYMDSQIHTKKHTHTHSHIRRRDHGNYYEQHLSDKKLEILEEEGFCVATL